jgi:hypothetical protein
VEIRAPFVGVIRFDGQCLTHEPDLMPEDGVYGRFVVKDGRVTEFLPEEVPAYTPPPCPPEPAPCGDCLEPLPALSVAADNLTFLDTDGSLLTRVYAAGTGSASVSGKGTPDDPLKVNVAAPELGDVSISTTTPEALRVTGRIIDHVTSPAGGQVVGGIEFDQYGHAVKAAESSGGTTGVVSLDTVEAAIRKEEQGGAVVLTLPTQFDTGRTIVTGRQEIDVDIYGRVTAYRDGIIDELDRVSAVVTGGWTEFSFSFGMYYAGYLRLSFVCDLNYTFTAQPYPVGLTPLPAGFRVFLDGTQFQCWMRTSYNRAAGLEGISVMPVAGAEHVLRIEVPVALSATAYGLLDISRCRP